MNEADDRTHGGDADDARRPRHLFAALWSIGFLGVYGLGVAAVLVWGWFSSGRDLPDDVAPRRAVEDVSDRGERPTVQAGSPREDRIDELGERDEYTVCTSTTDFVTVRMERPIGVSVDELDPYLEVFSTPDGALVTFDDDGAGDLNSQVVLEPTETVSFCYLVVARALADASTGAYTLTVETGAPEVVIEPGVAEFEGEPDASPDVTTRPRIELVVPTELQATIDEPGSVGTYTVCSSPTDVVTIRMERPISVPVGELDPYLEVFTDEGSLLSADDDGGGGLDSLIVLEPGNDCFLVVAGDLRHAAMGKYLLITSLGEPPRVGAEDSDRADSESLYEESFPELIGRSEEVDVPTELEATIENRGEVDPYSICTSAADTITIEMERGSEASSADLDPLLALYSERGALVALDDDGGEDGNSRIVYPSTDECYLLIASDAFRRSTGTYVIAVTQE